MAASLQGLTRYSEYGALSAWYCCTFCKCLTLICIEECSQHAYHLESSAGSFRYKAYWNCPMILWISDFVSGGGVSFLHRYHLRCSKSSQLHPNMARSTPDFNDYWRSCSYLPKVWIESWPDTLWSPYDWVVCYKSSEGRRLQTKSVRESPSFAFLRWHRYCNQD